MIKHIWTFQSTINIELRFISTKEGRVNKMSHREASGSLISILDGSLNGWNLIELRLQIAMLLLGQQQPMLKPLADEAQRHVVPSPNNEVKADSLTWQRESRSRVAKESDVPEIMPAPVHGAHVIVSLKVELVPLLISVEVIEPVPRVSLLHQA